MAEVRRSSLEETEIKMQTAAVITSFVLFFTLNIIMLIIGYIEKGECPAQENIPTYLFVAGAIGMLSKILPFIERRLNFTVLNFLIFCLYIFEIGWTILGSIWVYGVTPNYNKDSGSQYCSKMAYLLSFWLLTTHWMLVVLFTLGGCIYLFVVGRTVSTYATNA